MSTPRQFTITGAFAATLIAGCAVGPDYRPPSPSIDSAFIGDGASAINAQRPSDDIAAFCREFGDPTLDALVSRAPATNADVRIAQARLQEAKASFTGARAALFPEVDAAVSSAHSLAPASEFPGTTQEQRTAYTFEGGFIASWELDFFARNRRAM
jgi:multidrug efflux system outer membrane protein